MKQRRHVIWRSALLMVVIGMATNTVGNALAVTDPSWATPSVMTLRRVSDLGNTQQHPSYLSNLDCTFISYRMVQSGSMQSGCFTPTAFGMVDVDRSVGLYNGTDEAVPLLAYGLQQGVIPWPKALEMLALTSAATDGSYVSMYRDPISATEDKRDVLGRLTAKQFRVAPDFPLHDEAGHRLQINPQTLAFSDSGSWMVAETLYGRFVRINLATLDVTAFAPAFFNSVGSSMPLDSEVAISDDGRYVAIGNKIAASFKVYDLAKCPAPGVSTICPGYEYRPFIDSQISGLKLLKHPQFVNGGLLSFEATSSSGSGLYELAPTDGIQSLTDYIGLGDSYTSGEGAFNYLPGTDTLDNHCHLSVHSYPLLLTRDLFSAAGGHSVACSGAVIKDIGSQSLDYRGQARGSPNLREFKQSQSSLLTSVVSDLKPGYVAQHRFVATYQPRVVTVSIGGNDIGFGNILQACVTPHPGHDTCYDSYEDRLEIVRLIDRTVPRWTALYRQLQAEAPGSQLYVIGYPQIAVDNGNCALNVRLSQSEIRFSEELIDYLDEAIEQAAAAADAPYVDISQALAGHRLCETASHNVAVNGLTAGNDIGGLGVTVLGKESYHPTAFGQELIEQSILRQTHNLTLGMPKISVTGSSQAMLSAPKTNRQISTIIPSNNLVSGVLRSASSINIRVDGLDSGLRPNTSYMVYLDGSNGNVMATLLTDGAGTLSGQVTVPSTTSGGHTIDVIGTNQADEPVDITQPVYIGPATDDADGDGIVGASDSCPLIPHSGQDTDQDGVDDVCDGFIGQSVSTGTPSSIRIQSTIRIIPARHFATVSKLSINHPSSKTSDFHLFQSALGAATTHAQPRTVRLITVRQKIPVIGWISVSCGLILLAGRAEYINSFIKRQRSTTISTMNILRKIILGFLSLLLLMSLVGGAQAVSANMAFRSPDKIETWLEQSKFYDHLIDNALDQAQKSTDTSGAGSVSFKDPAVHEAAKAVFTPTMLKQITKQVLDANYAWLNGTVPVPTFSVDLSADKQKFAEAVGKSVEAYLNGLPICSAAQLQQLQNELTSIDPYALPCRPATLAPQLEASLVTQDLLTSKDFIDIPVITANSSQLNPNNGNTPYYERFSKAPKLYQLETKLPWLYGVLALVSLLGIVAIAQTRRRGLRRIGFVMITSGVILVAIKFIGDAVVNRVEQKVFNQANSGPLQQSLTDFLHFVEQQIVKVDFWFGLAFLIIGIVLAAVFFKSGSKGSKPEHPKSKMPEATQQPTPQPAQPPKRPRLIQ